MEHIGLSVFREGERLAAEAARERDEVRRLRRSLEAELGRLRDLNEQLQRRLAALTWLERHRRTVASR
jgi:hypothetical protein